MSRPDRERYEVLERAARRALRGARGLGGERRRHARAEQDATVGGVELDDDTSLLREFHDVELADPVSGLLDDG